MTSLLTMLVLGIVGVIAAAEFCGWGEYAAWTLVIRAARRVPASLKERLEEEWVAELSEWPTGIAKFVFAFSIYSVGTRRLASDGAFPVTRLTRLWIAVAAVAITALLTVAAGLFPRLVMRVFLAHHDQWWWALLIHGLMYSHFLSLGIIIALHRRRVRRRIVRSSPPLAPLGL
jgi:hypothetical protein